MYAHLGIGNDLPGINFVEGWWTTARENVSLCGRVGVVY